MTKQVKFHGRGRSHGRKAPSGRQYTFRSHYWTEVDNAEDIAYFETVDCLEVRDKPTTEKVQEAAETASEAASGFMDAVRKAGGSVASMLDGMGYDQKHEAADELDLDVPGNASHDDLNEAIQTEVDRRTAEDN